MAVAEELHFGNAALRLGLSQPQVSRHVANLERELEVTLFTRTPRATTLTDAGSELLVDARETIASVERLRRRARQVARGGLGTVTVGFVWSTLSGYLAPLLSAAGDSRRRLDVSVTHLRFTDLVPARRRGVPRGVDGSGTHVRRAVLAAGRGLCVKIDDSFLPITTYLSFFTPSVGLFRTSMW